MNTYKRHQLQGSPASSTLSQQYALRRWELQLTYAHLLPVQGGLLVAATVCILAAGIVVAQDTTAAEAVSTTQPLASVNITSSNVTSASGAAGEELKKQIDDNSEAQEYKENTKPVKAQIVKQEAAANLESGTGDVSTTGANITVAAHRCLAAAVARWCCTECRGRAAC